MANLLNLSCKQDKKCTLKVLVESVKFISGPFSTHFPSISLRPRIVIISSYYRQISADIKIKNNCKKQIGQLRGTDEVGEFFVCLNPCRTYSCGLFVRWSSIVCREITKLCYLHVLYINASFMLFTARKNAPTPGGFLV